MIMCKTIKTSSLCLALLFMFGCSKDNSNIQDEIENQPSSDFTVTIEVNKNTAQLNWTASEDPEGDDVTYDVFIDNVLVNSQTTTSYNVLDLLYDEEYQGSIIANDRSGNEIEVPFTFTTDYLKLSVFEYDNGDNNYFVYEHNEENVLTNLIQNFDNTHTPIQYNSDGNVAAIGNNTYAYNFHGLLTSIDNGLGTGSLNFLYDDLDRIREVNITRIGATDNYVSNSKMSYIYNDLGNLIMLDIERSFTADYISGTQKRYLQWELFYDDENENVTEYTLSESQDGITYTERFREIMVYDNKKNPWFTMLSNQLKLNSKILFNAPVEFYVYPGANYFFEGYRLTLFGSRHNILNHKIFLDNELLAEYSFTYTYNASGYPISAKHTSSSSDKFPKWTYLE